jgi:hypothetical protein
MPEQHGHDAGDAEDKREGKEVPFLAQEIDIRIAEKFHLKTPKSSGQRVNDDRAIALPESQIFQLLSDYRTYSPDDPTTNH